MTQLLQQSETQSKNTKRLLGLITFLIALDLFFLSFNILDAYAWATLYTSLALFSSIGLVILAGMILFLSLFEGYWIAPFASLLSLGIGVGTLFLGPFIIIFTAWLIIFAFVALIAYGDFVLFQHPNSIRHALTLLSITILFSLSWILMEIFIFREYNILKHWYNDDKSYHLGNHDSDVIYGQVSIVRLYECNYIGVTCHRIYESPKYFYSDNLLTWEITEGVETIITIIYDGEVIHREVNP